MDRNEALLTEKNYVTVPLFVEPNVQPEGFFAATNGSPNFTA